MGGNEPVLRLRAAGLTPDLFFKIRELQGLDQRLKRVEEALSAGREIHEWESVNGWKNWKQEPGSPAGLIRRKGRIGRRRRAEPGDGDRGPNKIRRREGRGPVCQLPPSPARLSCDVHLLMFYYEGLKS